MSFRTNGFTLTCALFPFSPQYYEIYKHKEVIGISIIFMFVDFLGGVFNDLSLAFKDHFDVIPAITYSLVVVSPSSQHLCSLILLHNLRSMI